jgi:hypothetical protein
MEAPLAFVLGMAAVLVIEIGLLYALVLLSDNR